MPYRWEPTAGVSGRYRDERGRFVASSTVRRELDRYLDTDDPAKADAAARMSKRGAALLATARAGGQDDIENPDK